MKDKNLRETFKDELYKSEWAERVAIGLMLNERTGAGIAIEFVKLDPTHFYFANTRTLFKAIRSVYMQRKPVDVSNVVLDLEDALNDIGGLSTIHDCMKRAEVAQTVSENIRPYFEILGFYRNVRNLVFFVDRKDDEAII